MFSDATLIKIHVREHAMGKIRLDKSLHNNIPNMIISRLLSALGLLDCIVTSRESAKRWALPLQAGQCTVAARVVWSLCQVLLALVPDQGPSPFLSASIASVKRRCLVYPRRHRVHETLFVSRHSSQPTPRRDVRMPSTTFTIVQTWC